MLQGASFGIWGLHLFVVPIGFCGEYQDVKRVRLSNPAPFTNMEVQGSNSFQKFGKDVRTTRSHVLALSVQRLSQRSHTGPYRAPAHPDAHVPTPLKSKPFKVGKYYSDGLGD